MVNSVTRTHCKKCRLEKCLRIGMMPEKVDRVGGKKASSVQTAEGDFVNGEVEDIEEVEVMVLEALLSESSSSDREFSESYESSDRLDIGSLVEECVLEENLETNIVRCKQKNKFIPEHIGELMFEVVKTMKATSPYVSLHNEPVFNFTLEEEFKIYELVARKDSLVDAIFGIKLEIPQFKMFILNTLSQGEFDYNGTSENHKFKKGGTQKLKTLFGISLNPGGKIRACLDMFDEYKNVDQTVKYETFDFSLKILHLCTR